jgi:phospholipid/cholesterol/gamma-HCH transport system substrate-binding protein
MDARRKGESRIHPVWWAVVLFAVIAAIVLVCSSLFAGTFSSFVPVTLTSDRSGLVMESGAKVKMRGVEVGRVAAINGGKQTVSLKLDIFPDQARYIPANVEAQIRATTAFGAKYVDLIYPDNPSPKRLASGAVLRSRNVSTEVNTVFQNLVGVLHQVDVAKLNATLSAFAEGVRGQGERIGEATTGANEVLLAINPRMGLVQGIQRRVQRSGTRHSGHP